MHGKDIGIGFFVFDLQIGRTGIAAVTPRINPKHIDGWFTLDNPFSQLPPSPTRGGNAKAVAFTEPEIWQIPCRSDNGIPIRCIGNCPIIDFLDTTLAKSWYPVNRRFNMRLQPFQILLKQLIFRVIRRPVNITGRRPHLIGAKDQATRLFAHVPASIRITQDPHLRLAVTVPRLNIRMRLGHNILVFNRDYRHIKPHHLPSLARKIAGCTDHMFTTDLALVGGDFPLA